MLAAALAALVGCAAAADQTHYTVLGVARTASPAEIKRSYYRLAKGVHPDRLSSAAPADERAAMAERFKRVAEAYTVLSDKSSRAAYDAALARGAAATTRADRPPAQRPPAQRPPVARPPPSPGRGFGASGVARVDDLESLLALGNASAAGILRRHVLLAVGDGRAPACARSLANAKFPFPFAGMTQEWHGLAWESLLVAATHDASPALSAGLPLPPLLRLCGEACSPSAHPVDRAAGSASLSLAHCPAYVFFHRGVAPATLSVGREWSADVDADGLQAWVWRQLSFTLEMENKCDFDVRVNWIHGGYVKPMVTLGARQSATQRVYLAHTLQAEAVSRVGKAISENSSLLITALERDDAMLTITPRCVDASSDCEYWARSGDCETNRRFMVRDCARSCGACTPPPPPPRTGKRSAAPPPPLPSSCKDAHDGCSAWVEAGECLASRAFMRLHCARSCAACGTKEDDDACADEVRDCEIWAASGDCDTNAAYMRSSCRRSCGACGDEGAEGVVTAVGAGADGECADSEASNGRCKGWADGGGCEKNRRFMAQQCARTCKLCGGGEHASTCADEDIKCETWAAAGECKRNGAFMARECARSCGTCAPPSMKQRAAPAPPSGGTPATGPSGAGPTPSAGGELCTDAYGDCPGILSRSPTSCATATFMQRSCKRTCGLCGGAEASRGALKQEL